MALIVQKFGGTSVGSLEKIQAVAEKIMQTRAEGHEIVVVVSAMGGETDRLINLAKTIQSEPDAREYATLVTTGEQISIALLAMALIAQGCPARSFTGSQAQIHTDDWYKKARILGVDCHPLREALAAGQVPVVAGFQGTSPTGDITTLGRGGSDTTAVALAASLGAGECQIYTDVDGIYTADPRIVPGAHCLEQISFAEMMELSSLGTKVLQQRSVELAHKYQVPLRVLSSAHEGAGTLVGGRGDKGMEQPLVSGIALSRQEAKLTVSGTKETAEILALLAEAQIEIDMLVQSQEGDFTFTLPRDDYERAFALLHKKSLIGDTQIAKISLIGIGLRSHPAIISLLFSTLNSQGIPIQLISTSEIRVSIVVNEKDGERSVRSLHTAFGLDG